MDAHELPSGELLVELVDAMNRGLQATILGDEPDIVAVRFRETDLGRAQEDHALAARSDDARRRAQPWLEAVALDLIAVFGSEDRERPDGLVAEEDWAKGDPGRLAGELGHDLCGADPVVVETSLLDGVTGEAAEVQARLPADCGVQCRHPRGDAQEEACRLVGDDDLAACVQDGMRLPGPRPCFRECRDQFGGAVAGALTQDRVRAGYCLRKPARGLGWKVGAPGRDVEDRNCIVSDRVPNGYAGTDPLVKASAPVLGPADQHGSAGLERRAHPVRARRPLRPARPRRHVAVARAGQRLLVAVDRQDPTRTIGDGHDAADVLDLGRDRRRGAPELGEHVLVLERLLRRGPVVRGRRRCLTQARVDVVLLATAVPRRDHLGSDPTNAIIALEEAFTRCRDRSVPLRVSHAVALCGLAHAWDANLTTTGVLINPRRPPEQHVPTRTMMPASSSRRSSIQRVACLIEAGDP